MINLIKSRQRSTSGFTLVETVLALGISATVLLPLVALLGQGMDQTERITSTDRVLRLSEALQQRLANESFDQVYEWIKSEKPFFVYTYLGTAESHEDGTAIADGNGMSSAAALRQGQSYAVARPMDERTYIDQESSVIEGRMFRVDLRVSALNTADQLPLLAKNYSGAALFVEAQFYSVANKLEYESSATKYEMTLHYVINR
ncbi:MAG: hypothetical protein KDN22_04580 [Verrucomicrobiae bacterium]|nr:hypothetical protein [Verrucomicrobiae bacterium]